MTVISHLFEIWSKEESVPWSKGESVELKIMVFLISLVLELSSGIRKEATLEMQIS